MPSNVELNNAPLPPLKDSPDIDPYTQKPRTYKGPPDRLTILRDKYRNVTVNRFNVESICGVFSLLFAYLCSPNSQVYLLTHPWQPYPQLRDFFQNIVL